MKSNIVGEAGYEHAMYGLSLSWNQPVANMPAVAVKLAGKGNGHDKFLRHIDVWFEIKAPIFWWNEFDQYKLRVADMFDIDTQSESTMHTLRTSKLYQHDFEYDINADTLNWLNRLLDEKESIETLKNELPSGFLQRRIVKLNYAQVYNIIVQRQNHRLPQWKEFIGTFVFLSHKELLEKAYGEVCS